MGGSIAISLKLREDQYEAVRDLIPTREISFLTWTNWIGWVINNPELWIKPDSKFTKSENDYLSTHAALKEILEVVRADSANTNSAGELQNATPEGYGIICLDLKNKNIFSSQGYCTPGNLYISPYSTAFEAQCKMCIKLCEFGAIKAGVSAIYTSGKSLTDTLKAKPLAKKLKALTAKGMPYSIWENGKLLENVNGGVPLPETYYNTTFALSPLAIGYLLQTSLKEIGQGVYPDNLNNIKVTTSGLFELTEYPEPTCGKEEFARLQALNAFFEENNWDSRIPIEKLNASKFTDNKEDYDFHKEMGNIQQLKN